MHTHSIAPWWRHRWPWLLMAGPAFVLVAGSYASYLAYSRQDALVVGDYYRQGKAINQDLRRDRAAGALDVRLALDYQPATGMLEGRIEAGEARADEPLLLHLAHATQPEKDVRLLLRPGADGRFSVPLPRLERSRWTVLAEPASRRWRLEGRWDWPARPALALRADPEARRASRAPADG